MHPLTPSARYFPRARRCGVRSKTRLVSVLARGPRNGLHPIVNVIPMAASATRQIKTVTEIFTKRIRTLPPRRAWKRLFDHGDTPCVPPALERRNQPDLHDLQRQFFREHSLAQ